MVAASSCPLLEPFHLISNLGRNQNLSKLNCEILNCEEHERAGQRGLAEREIS